MARISLGICLMLVVASSVIYEAQGTFLLKLYLKKNFPRKCNEFTPFANKGMMTLVTDLEGSSPATAEFKTFFSQFKSYMSFIETTSASTKNVDAEMTTKCDALFKAMSALSAGKGEKSAEAGGMKATLLSMGKTLVEQKKNTKIMTLKQKKELVIAMVKWTKMVATFVKSASEKKGKSINIASYGLDVDVNDSSIVGGAASSESSTKSGAVSTSGSVSTKTKESSSGSSANGSAATKSKESSGGSAARANFKDTTGKNLGSPSGSPKASPSGSVGGKSSSKESASAQGGASSQGSASAQGIVNGARAFSKNKETKTSSQRQSKSSSESSSSSTTTTTVKQVESETSKEVMSFITQLEKKYAAKSELKVFFESLKSSMQASASVGSKTAKDYVSASRAATGKLSEAMATVSSKNVKSAKMKSNLDTSKDELMKCVKQIQDINGKIVSGKTVSSAQQSELKQTITKWEKVTTQFVETAASSRSSSSSSSSSSSAASQQQGNAGMVKTN